MSSSDSDDDCYGHIAQKLQSIKNKYEEEKAECIVLNNDSELTKTSGKLPKTDENTLEILEEDCNVTVNSTDNDEYTLDAIIANNCKTKSTRGRGRGAKRKTAGDASEPAERATRASKRKIPHSNRRKTSPATDPGPDTEQIEQNVTTTASSSGRGNSTRGRGSRSRNRAARATPRGRRRNRRDFLPIFDIFSQNILAHTSNNYPTYSVGNTDEYPDICDSQELFATRTVNNDVEVVEETDPLDDENEEMSVKVYWQSLEVFKFKIRKYQKLTQIFEYFTEKENVSNDKLLFTYNDRILKMDDTPESIKYSIAKFIDGGIVNQNVTALVKDDNENVNNGLKIKFQCQDKKKAFKTRLRPEERLAQAMMKCAEHLEIPLERLKFYFDGDLLSSKTTPQDLELEGGECIDVKISSR